MYADFLNQGPATQREEEITMTIMHHAEEIQQ